MMARKIIQLSPTTHVVSLPTQWLRDHRLKKGDEVTVSEQPQGLLVEPQRKNDERKIELDLRGVHDDYRWALVDAAYIAGYEQCIIRIEPERADNMHKLIRYFPCFIVSEERKGWIIVKDVADPKIEDASQLLTRVYHMIIDMIQDGAEAYKARNWEILRKIKYRDYVINSYTSYTIRQLLREPRSFREKSLIHLLVHQTEAFADLAASILEKLSGVANQQQISLLLEIAQAAQTQWQKQQPSKELFALGKTRKLAPEIAGHAFGLFETGLQLHLLRSSYNAGEGI